MTAAKERWPWWWRLGVPVLVMLILTVGWGSWWYASDADLRRVNKEALAAGIPLNWTEWIGAEAPSPGALAAWLRLEERCRHLKTWVDEKGGPGKARRPTLGETVPENFIAHAAMLNVPLAEVIDALPTERFRLEPGDTATRGGLGNHAVNKAVDLQMEVIIGCTIPELFQACGRLLRLLEVSPVPGSTISLMMETSALNRIPTALALRRLDLSSQERQSLADRIDQLEINMRFHLLAGFHGSFVSGHEELQNQDVVEFLARTNQSSELAVQFLIRCGRENYFRYLIDEVKDLGHVVDSRQRHAQRNARALRIGEPHWWRARQWLTASTFYMLNKVISDREALRSRLILLSKLLRDEEPGIDPISGQTYRHYQRDGDFVGWYSPGFDGDDGGDLRRDWCLPWALPWKEPSQPLGVDEDPLPLLPSVSF